MSDGAEPSAERDNEELERETVATRLESVEQYLEYLKETNAYYDWLDPEILTVERGKWRSNSRILTGRNRRRSDRRRG